MATTLGSWSTPSEPGTVEIESDLDGSSLSIDVVDAAAITRAEIAFQLSGTLGDPTALQDDIVYGEDGWEDGTNRIAAVAHALWVKRPPAVLFTAGALVRAREPHARRLYRARVRISEHRERGDRSIVNTKIGPS